MVYPSEDRHIVERHDIVAIIGEDEESRLAIEQRLDDALEPLDLMEPHPLRRTVGHIVSKVGELLIGNVKLGRHRGEHAIGLLTMGATELHDPEQEQSLLSLLYLSVQ